MVWLMLFLFACKLMICHAMLNSGFDIQVGNAVPPPMSRAIGLEIKKSVVWKMENEQQGSPQLEN